MATLSIVEYKEDATPLSQREREERFRLFKERQEEERQRRLHELQQQSVLAQKFREQQEEERKRKIDELRHKDLERRMAVEERKRQIWEAEQVYLVISHHIKENYFAVSNELYAIFHTELGFFWVDFFFIKYRIFMHFSPVFARYLKSIRGSIKSK